MVEVTAWTFLSLGDEVALVLIGPIADRCRLVQADSRSLSQPALFISVSSRSTARLVRNSAAPRGGAQPNLGNPSHLTRLELGYAKDGP